jgi:ubiquinone/menaquinone biosynthesis C-methylase UbiE
MNTHEQPAKREHPSTYFVQDRSNEEELARLRVQDEMLTTSMGGVLPEHADASVVQQVQRVLDVGCGTGGWLIALAKAYPTMHTLIGVDISQHMVGYAREQAYVEQVDQRVRFQCMDALRMLEFPVNFFDLVNQRLGMSYLRVWDWPKLLQEYRRVTRPGGLIRMTEASTVSENSSPALTRIADVAHHATMHAGHLFTPHPDGVISMLASLMRQHGLVDVQTREYDCVYRAGTPEGEQFVKDMTALLHVGLPFLQKWTCVPDEYEELRQQAVREMRQPDFVAMWTFVTAWGMVSPG